MKSKKIIAMIVAFAAFMAVATSGLAAVTTTTEYNLNDSTKVSVDVTVDSAAAGKEVTYLVEAGTDNIVYIDQATANENGIVTFNYKIAKEKLAVNNYAATVKFGTDGAAFDWSGNDFSFAAVDTETDNANVTIKFYDNAGCSDGELANPRVGTKDEIFAKIFYNSDDYKIETVTGLIETATPDVYKVDKANLNNISVTTKAVVKDTEVNIVDQVSDDIKNIVNETTDDKMDYTRSTVKFIQAQNIENLPAGHVIGIQCDDPSSDDPNEKWVFPVVIPADANLSGVTYYAIRLVDNNGEIDSSKLVFETFKGLIEE